MRNTRIAFTLAISVGLVSLTGCAVTPKAPAKTQLEMRELQTRTFETPDEKAVLKAMINVLQDDGYMLKEANAELGTLSATKEYEHKVSFGSELLAAYANTQDSLAKNSILEATANVSKRGQACRVRATFQIKTLDRQGRVKEVKQIESAEHYTDFFAKVHKGIFLDVDQGL